MVIYSRQTKQRPPLLTLLIRSAGLIQIVFVEGGVCRPHFVLYMKVNNMKQEVFFISKETERINEEIRVRGGEIRVTDAEGQSLGVMQVKDALNMAMEQHLDLVEIAPKAKPPVCRIMDYGKYRYEKQKREKEARKKQKVISIKEVKLRPNIEQHDFDVKLKNATRFLADGDKVKVTIMFRGREMSHPELGKDILSKFADALKDSVTVERDAKLEGRNMIMILAPKAQTKGGKQ
ncbi:translation initiation factor IF-3 [Anaerovibrio lipolyticus DSM 3074]|uniref:Translation initiation factor IF-3 n=4 Tax=Anaerovibrio lipolyticus TaxID=82374 RepID=A0A1M6GD69_9FIRM|nr:translation initiation factor IF-3 [Anaerovibrio lipolyticus DSM 3074]